MRCRTLSMSLKRQAQGCTQHITRIPVQIARWPSSTSKLKRALNVQETLQTLQRQLLRAFLALTCLTWLHSAQRKRVKICPALKPIVPKFALELKRFTLPCALMWTNGVQRQKMLLDFRAFSLEDRLLQRQPRQSRPHSHRTTAVAKACTSTDTGSSKMMPGVGDRSLTTNAIRKTTMQTILMH